MAAIIAACVAVRQWVIGALSRARVPFIERILDLAPPLSSRDAVLDFGAGMGTLTQVLRARGMKGVTALDVTDAYGAGAMVYSGGRIPFPDRAFDVGFAIAVLHHIPKMEASLAELARVCKRVVVEDVPRVPVHFFTIGAMDSLYNLDFADNPHNNRTDPQWRALFDGVGLRVAYAVDLPPSVFHNRLYALDHGVVPT